MRSKWVEPTDRAGREQYRALRAEYKSRTSLRRKTEIEQDLNELCGTSLSDNGSHPAPTVEESRVPSVPVARQSLDEWLKRITSPEVQLQMHELDKSIAVEKAKNSTPAERAFYLLERMPDHALSVMARAGVENRRLEVKCAQTVPLETEVGWTLKHWLGPDSAKYNSNPLPPKTRSDVLLAIADIYRIVAVKDRDEPNWLVKAAEQRFAAPPKIWTLEGEKK
jgi:hypothetical protein